MAKKSTKKAGKKAGNKTKKAKATKKPRVTALLLGRGNNTLRDKNVLPVFGRPLLYYPAKAAYDSKLVDEHYVSSDDKKILDAAAAVGYKTIKRPKHMALPTSQATEAIEHALGILKKNKKTPHIIVVVMANSVSIKADWIDTCIRWLLEDDTLTCVAPVYQDSDHHPIRSKRINAEGLCEPFFDFAGHRVSTNRQDLDPSFYFSHNFWVFRTSNFEKKDDAPEGQLPWKFMGHRIKPFILKEKTIDIHELEDIEHSERWLRENAD